MNLARLRARLTSDEGIALPDVIVATIVSLVALSLIATSIFTFTNLQARLASVAGATSAGTAIDSSWRNDMGRAITITVQDSLHIVVTIDNNGGCQENTWAIDDDPAEPTLTMTERPCGTTTDRPGTTYPLATDRTAEFSFTNLGGRRIMFSGGDVTKATQTKPITVSTGLWESTAVGSAAVTVTVQNGFNGTYSVDSIEQTSPQSRLRGETDKPAEFVN